MIMIPPNEFPYKRYFKCPNKDKGNRDFKKQISSLLNACKYIGDSV